MFLKPTRFGKYDFKAETGFVDGGSRTTPVGFRESQGVGPFIKGERGALNKKKEEKEQRGGKRANELMSRTEMCSLYFLRRIRLLGARPKHLALRSNAKPKQKERQKKGKKRNLF